MTTPSIQEVQQFIDERPISRLQWSTFILCFLIVALDGMDIGLAAYIAPAVRADWQLSVKALSPVFVAGLVGMAAGSLVFGPLADRYGRRPVLLASVGFFALSTLATLAADNIWELSALRFLCGVGIGGATPTAATLTAEFAPARRRLACVTFMLCGNSMGSALGGVIASQIIPVHGWHAMLYIGGGVPLLLLPLFAKSLPESLRFLALRRPAEQARMRALAGRIAGAGNLIDETVSFVAAGAGSATRSTIRALLAPAFRRATLLLWASFFMTLAVLYLMASWLPTIVVSAGGSMHDAALTTAAWSIGGTCGGLVLGRIMDRYAPHRVLAIVYALACVFVFGVGQIHGQPTLLGWLVFCAGFCVSGSQVGLNGLAAGFYPTAVRATGVAWATGIGRTGSILGAAAGGLLLASGLDHGELFALLGVPALVACACMAGMPRRETAVKAVAASRP